MKPTPADGITALRILLSPILLFLSPISPSFLAVYAVCGLSDMVDGFVARRFGASRYGESLDSLADLLFCAVCAIRILPSLTLPKGIWVWTACIALFKCASFVGLRFRTGKWGFAHTLLNKLTGLSLFLLLPVLSVAPIFAVPVCLLATLAVLQEGKKGLLS